MKKLIGLLAILAPLAYAANGPVIKPNGPAVTPTAPGGGPYSIQISSGGVFAGVPLTIKAAGNAGDTQILNMNAQSGAQINWNTLDGVSNIGIIQETLSAQNMNFFATNSLQLFPGFGSAGGWVFDKNAVFTVPDPATITGGQLTLSASTFTISGAGAPTADQALCIHSGRLGHCTSVVGTGGDCTCVAP